MGKLILILSLAVLLILAGTIFLGKKQNLSITDYSYYKYQKWANCVSKIPDADQSCSDNNGQQLAKSAVDNLVIYSSPNALFDCIKFSEYQQIAPILRPEAYLNHGEHFVHCFYSKVVEEAAQTNACYYKKYFQPRYYTCAPWWDV